MAKSKLENNASTNYTKNCKLQQNKDMTNFIQSARGDIYNNEDKLSTRNTMANEGSYNSNREYTSNNLMFRTHNS